ncbi:transcription termination factor 2-like [Culicoides brevitarsis]|uniref:transcription termination factor 2-like n=1 Tax=Culicoides brevitarsis TaxID=469753 RepID=UPI00307BA854
MAGLDLAMLFGDDCDPECLPMASSGLESEQIDEESQSVEAMSQSEGQKSPINDVVDEESGYTTATLHQENAENEASGSEEDEENEDLSENSSNEENSDEKMNDFESSEDDEPIIDGDVDFDDEMEAESGGFLKEFLFYASPQKEIGEKNAQTSTPLRDVDDKKALNWTQSTISQVTSAQKTKQPLPAGFQVMKKRRISESSTVEDEFPVPNYKSSEVTIGFNRHLQELEALLADNDALPDTEDAKDTSEEDHKMALQVKEALKTGSVESWERLVDQLSKVRGSYGKEKDAEFFHDRRRIFNRLKTTYDSLMSRPGPDELEPTPRRMIKQLKEHQQNALKFMLWRETQDPCGGILADDMGLGKTVSIVGLVRATLEQEPKGMKLPPGIKYMGGTLVVCPPSITQQWADEFSESTNGVSVYVHHTESKVKSPDEFLRYHVVITSDTKVSYEMSGGKKLLFGVYWKRIVVDEAHRMRNYKTQLSKSICCLHGKLRWILTGTPIHNRVDDVYPYLIFLRCDPFDERNIFLKWAKSTWGRGEGRINVILKSLMIRRTKEELNLVPCSKIIEHFEYELDAKESECYQRLMSVSTMMMKIFLNNRAMRRHEEPIYHDKNLYKVAQIMRKRMHDVMNFQNILVLLLRLRQMCAHPCLIRSMLSQVKTQTESLDAEMDQIRAEDEHVMNAVINDAIEDREIFNINNEIFNDERPSTKIRMLLHILKERFIPTKDKALIVCEWTSYLHIIADYLSQLSLSYVFYTGETDMQERPEIVKRFNSDCMNPRILLLSLNCGGVGLNLTKANHIFFMCTHWNPQIERQAEDRCYRIGQERDVHIYKFRAEGSIEERIHQLQENKLKMADKMLTGATGNNYQLTIKDLKSLFGL